MLRFASILVVILVVAGCGPVPPGDDSDPVGAYRRSHSRSYGLLMPPAFDEVAGSRA